MQPPKFELVYAAAKFVLAYAAKFELGYAAKFELAYAATTFWGEAGGLRFLGL